MSLQTWALVIAVTGAVGGVAGYLHERDARVEAEAVRQIHQARADSLMEISRADSIAQARTDSLAALRIEQADSARARAERDAERAARAAQRAREDRDSLEAAIMQAPDSTALRDALDGLRASHETEVAAVQRQAARLRDALTAADSVIATQRDQILARDRTIVGLREALAASNAASNAAAGIDTSEGFVERWGGRLLAVGVGVGIGYLAAGG